MHSFLRSPLSISLAPFFALSLDALHFEHGDEEEDSDGDATDGRDRAHARSDVCTRQPGSVRSVRASVRVRQIVRLMS